MDFVEAAELWVWMWSWRSTAGLREIYILRWFVVENFLLGQKMQVNYSDINPMMENVQRNGCQKDADDLVSMSQ